MTNAYGFLTTSVQGVRERINPSPSVGVYGFGFCSNEGFAKRFLRSSSVEGKDGLSSAAELHQIMTKLREDRTEEDCKKMISSVDSDGNELVNFEEYKIMMMN
ncbi:hypothetical protein ACET3Z_011756 [Daucus carota]